MPQGNDSQVLAVLSQLKKAQESLNSVYGEEDKVSMNTLLTQLNAIIETHEFDDEHYDAAPVHDDEVIELRDEAKDFTKALSNTIFKNPTSQFPKKLALKALAEFDDDAEVGCGLKA